MNVLFRTPSIPLFVLASATAVSCTFSRIGTASAETDYGEVAMHVADILTKQHYLRQSFDDEVSARLLEGYLSFLDFNHLYFTGEDVDRFRSLYSTTLDDKVLLGDIAPAHEIFETFEKRVRERVAKVKTLLEEEKFTFDSDKTVALSRQDLPWPADEAAADAVWHDIIEGDLLQEHLRLTSAGEDEEGDDENKSEGENESSAEEEEATEEPEETPEERILKRYTRFLENLDDFDEEQVVNYFLSSLAAAYDPHSDWFSQSEWDNFTISMQNALVGIGALLSMKDGAAEIQGLVINGPAARGGELQVGDRIIGVGQGKASTIEDVTFMPLQKIVERIRGKKESIVRLKIVPADAEDPSMTRVVSIVRDEVKLKDKLATAQVIDAKNEAGESSRLGWIELPSFYADLETRKTGATADVRRLLERLIEEKISGLVLDLRGNGGGSLDEAINLTGLFIKRGPVVQSRDWRNKIDVRSSKARFPVYEGPLVVLTDRASASASEILAAALQDYHRAVVVGESSSFGKGTVQTIQRVAQYMPFLSNKDRAGALKVTIQKFYRISGGSTQLKGVVPDIVLPSQRDALDIGEASLEHPLVWDEVKPRDYAPVDSPLATGELVQRHQDRISTEPEFLYIAEDTRRLKQRIEENVVSLNEAERKAEVDRNKERRKEREKLRKERNADIAENDSGRYTIYSLTLDNVDAAELTLESDVSSRDSTGMILAKEREEAEKKDNLLPYGFDPEKLETLNILRDMIEIAKSRQTAKVE